MAVRTKSQLRQDLRSNVIDNDSGLITPARMRTVIENLIDSLALASSVVQSAADIEFLSSNKTYSAAEAKALHGKLVIAAPPATVDMTLPRLQAGDASRFAVLVMPLGGSNDALTTFRLIYPGAIGNFVVSAKPGDKIVVTSQGTSWASRKFQNIPSGAVVTDASISGTTLTIERLGGNDRSLTLPSSGTSVDDVDIVSATKTYSTSEVDGLNGGILLALPSGDITLTFPDLGASASQKLFVVLIAPQAAGNSVSFSFGGTGSTANFSASPGDMVYCRWNASTDRWIAHRIDNETATVIADASIGQAKLSAALQRLIVSTITLENNRIKHTFLDGSAGTDIALSGGGGGSNIEIVTGDKTFTQQESQDLDGGEVWYTGSADATIYFVNPNASGDTDNSFVRVVNMSPSDNTEVILSAAAADREEELILQRGDVVVGGWDNSSTRYEWRRTYPDHHPASQVVIVDIDNSGHTAATTVTYDLDDYWDEWRGKRVIFRLTDPQAHAVNIVIQPDASGDWLPSRHVHSQTLEMDRAWWYPGGSINFEPPRADRPEITVPELLPANARRYYGRCLLNRTSGQVTFNIAQNLTEADNLRSHDLSNAWETSGELVWRIDGEELVIPIAGADRQEPYQWTPSNATEVAAFATKYYNRYDRINNRMANRNTRVVGPGGQIILRAFSGPESENGQAGDKVEFAKLFDSGEFRFKNMNIEHHNDADGWDSFAKSSTAAALEKTGTPFSLIFTKGFDGGDSPPWLVESSAHAQAKAAVAPIIETISGDAVYRLDTLWEKWKNRTVYFALNAPDVKPSIRIEPSESTNKLVHIDLDKSWVTQSYTSDTNAHVYWEPPKGSRPLISAEFDGVANVRLGRIGYSVTYDSALDVWVEIVLVVGQNTNIPAFGSAASAIRSNAVFAAAFLDDAAGSAEGMIDVRYGTRDFQHESPRSTDRDRSGKYRWEPRGTVGLSGQFLGDQVLQIIDPNSSEYVAQGTRDAKLTMEISGAVSEPWSPPAKDKGAFINFIPLFEHSQIIVSEMSMAKHAADGDMEFTEASGARVLPVQPGNLPWKLIYADNYDIASLTNYEWLIVPLAPPHNREKSSTTAGSGSSSGASSGDQGAFTQLRRQVDVAQGVPASGLTINLGGSDGILVDDGATHLEVTVSSPAAFSHDLEWQYYDGSTLRNLYGSEGEIVEFDSGESATFRFGDAFFTDDSTLAGRKRLKTALVGAASDGASFSGGSLEMTIVHEQDVNSAAVTAMELIGNPVVLAAQTMALNLVGAAMTEVEFDAPVEYENLISLTIMLGTLDVNSEDAAHPMVITKDELDWVGTWGSGDVLPNNSEIKGWWTQGWNSTATGNQAGVRKAKFSAAYAWVYGGGQNSGLPGRIIAVEREGAYLTGLQVSAFGQQTKILRVSCMRKI